MSQQTKTLKPKQNVSQDELLFTNLSQFYQSSVVHIDRIMSIVNGQSRISLRVVDWFVTNYAKKYLTNYMIPTRTGIVKDVIEDTKFKVYDRYKLQLKAYSKRRFDPFCRWERISIPYKDGLFMETTLGQLNFFKWAIEYMILEYIEKNYDEIELDMNQRNSNASSRRSDASSLRSMESAATTVSDQSMESIESRIATTFIPAIISTDGKTRKKRQELTEAVVRCIRKEDAKIIVRFND